jgi:chromosomal replication initiation ATPase DnaA
VDSLGERKDLQVFFKTLQQGLKKFSLQELNESIEGIVSDKNLRKREQKLKTDCVISEICNEFNVNRAELLKGRGKGQVQVARKYAYCILHHDLELPIRYIAKSVFQHQWHTSVSVVINYSKSLNMMVKTDREFAEKLENLRSRIQEKIKNII